MVNQRKYYYDGNLLSSAVNRRLFNTLQWNWYTTILQNNTHQLYQHKFSNLTQTPHKQVNQSISNDNTPLSKQHHLQMTEINSSAFKTDDNVNSPQQHLKLHLVPLLITYIDFLTSSLLLNSRFKTLAFQRPWCSKIPTLGGHSV